jgi:ATP-dependent Clp protease adaptor protein ClpS
VGHARNHCNCLQGIITNRLSLKSSILGLFQVYTAKFTISEANHAVFWGVADTGTKTRTKAKTQTRDPQMFRVLILNDDYTPMDFVVEVLTTFFRKSEQEAVQIMLAVHHAGAGLCGVYTHEVAETKVNQVAEAAHEHGHPLQATMEPE